MCGIFCVLSSTQHVYPSDELRSRLQSRGPDSTRTLRLKSGCGNVYLTLCSTVLSLRGSKTVTQPFQDTSGDYTLCWNGEAWSIDGEPTTGNDTEAVQKLLVDAIAAATGDSAHNYDSLMSAKQIARALSRAAGPYAFVMFDRRHNRLFLGRDFLGRRSLLYRISSAGELVFSSVSDYDESTQGWQELDADGVYCLPLDGAIAEPTPFGIERRILGMYTALVEPYTSAGSLNGSLDSAKSVG